MLLITEALPPAWRCGTARCRRAHARRAGGYKNKLYTDVCSDPSLCASVAASKSESGRAARGRTQKRRRCGADADRPQTRRFSCCCPCILQGRISARQGRSCLGACCCTVVTAYYAPGCTYFCYDIPDRVQFGKQVSRPRGRSIIPRKYRGDAASGRPLSSIPR